MIDDLKSDRPERFTPTLVVNQPDLPVPGVLPADSGGRVGKNTDRIEKILPPIEDLRGAWAENAAKSDKR